MKKIILAFVLFCSLHSVAQQVEGYWYGTANPDYGSNNNYLIELILNQNKISVSGILNCYYRNTFRSYKINGSYNSMTRELAFFNLPIPFVGAANNPEIDCMMDFKGKHLAAVAGSQLTGKLTGREGYKYTCPVITFDLQLNRDAGNKDSVLTALRNFKETFQVWSPSATDTLVAATIVQRPIQNLVVNKEYSERVIEVQNEIEVNSDSLLVDFYDNGEIDGDSISIFFNDQLIAANLRLSTKSYQVNLKLDPSREANTIAMLANNLGSIPPNTALMIVYEGNKRHEIRLTSSLEKTAAIRIRRKK
jgi:hypothetical protein